MPLRVLVELGPTIDTHEWARQYAEGEVPDRVPYGLHRLADEGMTVVLRTSPDWAPIAHISRITAKVTGGARWPEALLSSPAATAADVLLCWEERSGIPTLLGRPKKCPVITGILWNTEPRENLSAFARRISKTAMRHANAVFVHSIAQVEALRDWGVEESRIHVVHFGIDTEFWDPSGVTSIKYPVHATDIVQPLIMSVGNDRHRNHGVLVDSMKEVCLKFPDARLELVTRKPQKLPPEIGTWRSSMTHSQLRELCRRSQVAAISTSPNIHVSGITATLESMAMGKPVVVTRTPGMEDYVIDGKTGIFVPPNDPESMAHAIIELVSDPDKRHHIGMAARESVLSNFSTRAMSRSLAQMIRSVAK